jgi:threonine dehydrogenase-like Zn-dependent dehydrogenase
VRNILGCTRCDHCRDGAEHACDSRRTIGVHVDGGYAERVAIPARNCTPLEDDVPFHLAAALQPFAVATHAVARSVPVPGSSAAVWGLGPIGVACCLAARVRGVEVVAAFDVNTERVEEARSLGIPAWTAEGPGAAAARLAEMVPARSLDVLLDCAGVPAEVLLARTVLRKRGAIVLVGNARHPIEVDLLPVTMDEQRLLGSRSYSNASWETAVRTLARSGYAAALGDEVGLDEALGRFALAAQGRGRHFTVIPERTA